MTEIATIVTAAIGDHTPKIVRKAVTYHAENAVLTIVKNIQGPTGSLHDLKDYTNYETAHVYTYAGKRLQTKGEKMRSEVVIAAGDFMENFGRTLSKR